MGFSGNSEGTRNSEKTKIFFRERKWKKGLPQGHLRDLKRVFWGEETFSPQKRTAINPSLPFLGNDKFIRQN
jgi:hypothetical protein